ncbi:MAG: hypothetical protein HY909_05240 [Deltaproteobacteria bacterium]|nr:hypothetical protein [Deltaproteobacteria bacterium]
MGCIVRGDRMRENPPHARLRVFALAAGLLGACEAPRVPGEGGASDAVAADSTADSTADQGGATDATARDLAPMDRGADPCADVTDLSTAARDPDGTLRVRGDNRAGAPGMYGDLGRLPEGGCLATMDGVKGRVVLWRYTLSQRAVLRVSTANPGTADPRFDTVVAVLPACSLTARPLACNDDASGDAPHALHSTATTGLLPAGTVVYLVVGGHGEPGQGASVGDFELSVRELPPGVRGSVCRVGDAGSACDPGLTCSTTTPSELSPGTCLGAAAPGDPCGEDLRCAPGSTCGGSAPGSAPRCLPDGALGGRCRLSGSPCDAGLACTQRAPSAGYPGVCRPSVGVGAGCDPSGEATACEAGASCVTVAMDPRRSECVALGVRGGHCRAGMSPCAAGLACSNGQPSGFCRETVPREGAGCDLSGRTSACGVGLSCAPEGASGVCRRNGTAAGTACRDVTMDGGTRCDAGLSCTADSGPGGCLRDAPSGGACDPSGRSTRCPRTELCVGATPLAGTCRAFPEVTERVSELEPNDSPASAQGPVARGAVFQGAVEPGGRDCFALAVPARAALSLETELPRSTGCLGGDTILTLHGPSGALLARNDDREAGTLCSRISGLTTPAARDLPAGTYAVCVSGFAGMAVRDYDLTALVLAP